MTDYKKSHAQLYAHYKIYTLNTKKEIELKVRDQKNYTMPIPITRKPTILLKTGKGQDT